MHRIVVICGHRQGRDRAQQVPGPNIAAHFTEPAAGDKLPVILLSHGHGPSLYTPSKDGYGPLANFLAERGFVVIQPTHANSKVAGFPADAPGAPLFWRERVKEMTLILDGLDAIEAMLPVIAGRLDRDRIAAVGHSLGGQTVGLLLGARVTVGEDENAHELDLIEPRIKAGVLLGAPGAGGDDLSEGAKRYGPAFSPDFSYLTTSALVVFGNRSPRLLDSAQQGHLRQSIKHPAQCARGIGARWPP